MGPYKKVCEYCKKEFTSRNITQRFCCSECRELYHKKKKKEYKKFVNIVVKNSQHLVVMLNIVQMNVEKTLIMKN